MKKASLLALAAGFGLILIALTLSGFSAQRISNDVKAINQKDLTVRQGTFDARGIQQVKTDVNDVKVVIKTQTDTSRVTVDYFETNADKFVVTHSGDTLSVGRKPGSQKHHFICFFRCISNPYSITIRVPANSVYAYNLMANNAPVAFENGGTLQTQAIHIVSSNSNVDMQRLAAAGTVYAQSDNGSIRLHDVTSSGTLTLESSNASNELVNVQAPAINSTTDNGSVLLHAVTTVNLTAHSSNASITLDRLTADHATLTSDNGSVEGSIIGAKEAYDLGITSDNGSITVDNTSYGESYRTEQNSRGKSVKITASNAAVNVNFVK
ncbi:MAG TPA: DUF4097 family beta strand repeat-containing protein [Candidatus Saccharimonadales bacterium]|nr:DUF4097 family beta strand repeat-containing protein [Candidatus Saccharimonadales bacterium]